MPTVSRSQPGRCLTGQRDSLGPGSSREYPVRNDRRPGGHADTEHDRLSLSNPVRNLARQRQRLPRVWGQHEHVVGRRWRRHDRRVGYVRLHCGGRGSHRNDADVPNRSNARRGNRHSDGIRNDQRDYGALRCNRREQPRCRGNWRPDGSVEQRLELTCQPDRPPALAAGQGAGSRRGPTATPNSISGACSAELIRAACGCVERIASSSTWGSGTGEITMS